MKSKPKATRAERRGRRAAPGVTIVRTNIMGQVVGDPVVLDRRRRRLAPLVKRYCHAGRSPIVSVHRRGDILRPSDDTVRMRATWAKTLVGPDDIVLLTYVPLGSGSGGGASTGKQLGAAIGMLALALAAPYAIGALGGLLGTSAFGTATSLTFLGKLAAAGIVIGGGYLLAKATQAKANTPSEDSPVYGVSGGGTLAKKGERIPVGYGLFWTQPDLTQPDYFAYDGDDVVLYKRMTLGLGEYDVQEIQIGTATLWTKAGGVRPPYDTVPGGIPVPGGGAGSTGLGLTAVEIIAPSGSSTLVPGRVWSNTNVSGIELPRYYDNPQYAGPWATTEVGVTSTTIQLDYEVVACYHTTLPDTVYWSATFWYAPCDDDDVPTGPWVVLHTNGATTRFTRAQRFTKLVTVPAGRYVVRAQCYDDGHGVVINGVIWTGLRSHFPSTITRPHVTEIALRVRSGKALGSSTSFSDIWVQAHRILPTWNGSAWVNQATRKAVYAFRDVMTSSYGGNLTDGTQVDSERVKYYAGALSEFDTFDGVIRGPVSLYDAACAVLGPMRAEPLIIGALWTINRDEPKAARRHVFSRRQIVRGSSQTEITHARDDGSADVIAEYAIGADPRKRRDVRQTVGAQSITPTRIGLTGVSSYTHAAHLARWRSAIAAYRYETRKFSCDRQGRLVWRGDPVRADIWFVSGGRTGGVMARSGLLLTLDTEMEIAASRYAMLRDRLGREWGPIAVTWPDTGKPNEVLLDTADVASVEAFYGQSVASVIALDNEAMTTVLVGPLDELQESYLIRAVQPRGYDQIEIEAVRDADEVWTALGEPLPVEPPIPSKSGLTEPDVPTVPWVRGRCVVRATTLTMEWACGAARGAASYVIAISYDDGDTYEPVSNGSETSGSYPIHHVEGGAVTIVAYAVNAQGSPGPFATNSFETFEQTVTIENLTEQWRRWIESGATDGFTELRGALARVNEAIGTLALQHPESIYRVRQEAVALEGRSQASVEEVKVTIATNEESLALYKITLSSQFGDLQSQITNNYIALTDSDVTLAGLITTLDSRVDDNEAAITSEALTRATETSALAAEQETISASVGDLSATVTIHATAIATLNGQVGTAYGVTLDSNGYAIGFGLVNGGPGNSNFDISVDHLRVAKPGVSGGSPTLIMELGDVNGSPALTLKGTVIADNLIINRHIQNGEISASAFANGGDSAAISIPSTDTSPGTSAFQGSQYAVLATAVVPKVRTNLIKVDIFAYANVTYLNVGGAFFSLVLKQDGVVKKQWPFTYTVSGGYVIFTNIRQAWSEDIACDNATNSTFTLNAYVPATCVHLDSQTIAAASIQGNLMRAYEISK